MGTIERRQREKENLRRSILDAARELFVTQGFDNVSMRKIADKIEYSPTTIYLHFKDKDEIFVVLAEEGFTLLAERLEPLHMRVSDPIARLRAGGEAYLEFAQEHSHYYQIMFELKANPMRSALYDRYATDFDQSAGFRAFGFILRCVQEGIVSGRIPHGKNTPENVSLLSHVVWASIHGAVSLILSERAVPIPCSNGEGQPAEFLDFKATFFPAVLDNIIRGLTAPLS